MPTGFFRAVFAFTLLLSILSEPCRAQVFYEIVAPDGSRDWLLGTVHAEDERILDFPPVLLQALRQVDVVALELAPDRAMLEQLQREMRLPDDARLSDLLPNALYQRALTALIEEGVPEQRALHMRPWAAAMVLAQPPGATGGFMDLALARVASHRGIGIEALETIDEQVEFFRGLRLGAQQELLRGALDRLDRRAADLDRIVSVYLDGDLAALEDLAEAHLSGASSELRERFQRYALDVRNRRMAERAVPMLSSDSVLIAVGALHLVGPGGLPARLRAQGFEVTGIY